MSKDDSDKSPKEENVVIQVEMVIPVEMVREEKQNKCCKVMKEDVHIAGKCCAYSWCFTLNGIECCCVTMSACCVTLSNLALYCNKCLEEIDCDTHLKNPIS